MVRKRAVCTSMGGQRLEHGIQGLSDFGRTPRPWNGYSDRRSRYVGNESEVRRPEGRERESASFSGFQGSSNPVPFVPHYGLPRRL